MTDSTPAEQKPGPSRKAIIGWTVGMLAVLGLAWFVGAVVVPVWQVRSVLKKRPDGQELDTYWVKELGGPERAPAKIRTYASLFRVEPAEGEALADLLCVCKEKGTPVLVELVEKGYVRKFYALMLLRRGMSNHPSCLPLLEEMISRKDDKTARSWAAEALYEMDDPRAVELLLRATRDPEWDVRFSAIYGLLYQKNHAEAIIPVLKRIIARKDDPLKDIANQSLLVLEGKRTPEDFYIELPKVFGRRGQGGRKVSPKGQAP